MDLISYVITYITFIIIIALQQFALKERDKDIKELNNCLNEIIKNFNKSVDLELELSKSIILRQSKDQRKNNKLN